MNVFFFRSQEHLHLSYTSSRICCVCSGQTLSPWLCSLVTKTSPCSLAHGLSSDHKAPKSCCRLPVPEASFWNGTAESQ